MVRVSLVCPVYNEEEYIRGCIDSILSQDYSKNAMEVFFVDGSSVDDTVRIIEEYIKNYSFITLLHNPDKIVPVAMNLGIRYSKGDIIIRIDAHATYPCNYVSTLVKKSIELDADNVGCICKTDVLHKNQKTLSIQKVLSNRLGAGNAIFRLGVNHIKEVDTVPFGCWKRSAFELFGYFDERLIRNQDIELNKRIKRGGGKIYLVPDTYCTYLARETFRGIAQNNYANGKWNILTVFYTKKLTSLSVRHFIPLIFLLSLMMPLILSVFNIFFFYMTLASLFAYLFLITGISCLLSIKHRLDVIYIFLAFVILHLSYGFGSLIGIFKLGYIIKFKHP
jgi:glycosyltransferase involved in cell wall biosynthesis